jgi:hypothetical protein
MPLRKQGTIIQTSAVIALVVAAAALPTSASAFSIFDLISKKAPVVTAPQTPVPPVTAIVEPTVESTQDVAEEVADVVLADDEVAAAVLPSNNCPVAPVSKAFAKYKDTADYSPAPGGDFENGSAGWTLLLGAKIVSGNESTGGWAPTSVLPGKKSLQLPLGGTALSPEFCVDETNPHFRFMTKPDNSVAGYAAIVLYRDSGGKVQQAKFTSSASQTFSAGAWNPSPPSPLATKIPLLNGDNTATVQVLFVSTGNLLTLSNLWGKLAGGAVGTVSIDSVMVDPYRRG